ncbi:MAG: hypothetical protein HYY43_05545 [Deltaproteobacteria bacterium]|nr:hypothetical protein [Deltaproteobacteria bacterium]
MVRGVDSYRCLTQEDPLSDAGCRNYIAQRSAEEAKAFASSFSRPAISTDNTDLSKMTEVKISAYLRPATGSKVYDTRGLEAYFRKMNRKSETVTDFTHNVSGMVVGGISVAVAEVATTFEIPFLADIGAAYASFNTAVAEALTMAGIVAGAATAGAIIEAQVEPMALQAKVLQVAQEAPLQRLEDVRAYVPVRGQSGNPSHGDPLNTPEGRREELQRRFRGIAPDVGLARNVGEFGRQMMRVMARRGNSLEPLTVVVVTGRYGPNGSLSSEFRYVRGGLPHQLVLPGESVVSVGVMRETSPGVLRIESPAHGFRMNPRMPLGKALSEIGARNVVEKGEFAEFLYPVAVRSSGHLRDILSHGVPMRYVVVSYYRNGQEMVETRVGAASRKGDAGLLHSSMFSYESGERLIAAGEARIDNGRIIMNGLSPEYPTAKRDILGEYAEDFAPKEARGLEPALQVLNGGLMRNDQVRRDPVWNL